MANCSGRTLETYAANLAQFQRNVAFDRTEEATPLAVQSYLSSLREQLKPISAHQHFRTRKTFFNWGLETGLLSEHPMRGLHMRMPKTLPRVPEDDDVRNLLRACSDTFEGRRNRALIALLADSGLRISEALHLRIEDANFATRTIVVRGGKGGKDGLGFFGAEVAQYVRAWLVRRREVRLEDQLFVDRSERSLTRHAATHILHRLSARAGLSRKIGPHALRHYAATSILRQTGDLELVRQVLRHESLTMALRYGIPQSRMSARSSEGQVLWTICGRDADRYRNQLVSVHAREISAMERRLQKSIRVTVSALRTLFTVAAGDWPLSAMWGR